MDFSIMFNVLEGGVVDAIPWSKDAFTPDRSIIVLDEGSTCLYLWHGARQGLVARRTALRQAESLKGHGYTIGKSIIGRDTKVIKEIDSRKVGRVPEDTDIDKELQILLGKEFRELDGHMVTFQIGEFDAAKAEPKPVAAPTPKPEPKPVAVPTPKPEPKPVAVPTPKPDPKPISAPAVAVAPVKPSVQFASEYDTAEPLPSAKIESKSPATAAPAVIAASGLNASSEAKVGFVIMGVLNLYDDIWISRKSDNTYSIEMMDGPVCEFSIVDGKIKFSANAFTGLPANIKSQVQNKFIELSNLLK